MPPLWWLVLVFGFSFCTEPFLVCDVRVTRAALYQRVCLCPRECMFLRARSQTFAVPLFAEDFSSCAASESTPVASGSWPSALRVRFLPVGFFSSCCSRYPRSRIQVVALWHPGYSCDRRPVYIRDPYWVPTRCRPIEAYINAVPWFRPAVIFTHRVGSLTSFVHSRQFFIDASGACH